MASSLLIKVYLSLSVYGPFVSIPAALVEEEGKVLLEEEGAMEEAVAVEAAAMKVKVDVMVRIHLVIMASLVVPVQVGVVILVPQMMPLRPR